MASVTKRQWTHNGVTKSAWTVRYVDMGGVHRSKGFPTKKEADAYRAKVESDIRRGILAPQADQITVGEAADEFLKHMAHRVKDGRIGEDYRVHIERFIKLHVLPHLQRAKLSAVNLDMLTKWHRDIHKARKISPATGRNAAQALKQIFDFAIRREWTHRNPVLPLLAEMRGIEPAKVRTFSVEEMRALLNALEIPMYRGRRPEAALRLKIAVHLAVFCSLRIGEIHGLRIDQLSLETGTLRVNSNLARYGGLKGPKSRAGNRVLAMPRHVVAMLEEWMGEFYRDNPAGLVFVQKNGEPRNQDGTRHGAWAGLLYRAGLSDDPRKPSFHFHALRHFFASWAIDAGWALTEAARAMGHSKVDMTLSVYAHALRNQGADATAMQSLSDRLLLSPPAQELRNAA